MDLLEDNIFWCFYLLNNLVVIICMFGYTYVN
jgi:hypothetical protein